MSIVTALCWRFICCFGSNLAMEAEHLKEAVLFHAASCHPAGAVTWSQSHSQPCRTGTRSGTPKQRMGFGTEMFPGCCSLWHPGIGFCKAQELLKVRRIAAKPSLTDLPARVRGISQGQPSSVTSERAQGFILSQEIGLLMALPPL